MAGEHPNTRQITGDTHPDGRQTSSHTHIMSTAIMSIGLHLVGTEWLSLIFLGIAAALWLWFLLTLPAWLIAQRWAGAAGAPLALAGVAGTAVLGVRLVMLGWLPTAAGALVLAAVLWIPVVIMTLRRLGRMLPDAAYLGCVATQAVVALAAVLAIARGTPWVLWPGVIVSVFGLGLYLGLLLRFAPTRLRTDAGGHWQPASATAISAVAGSLLTGVGSGAVRVGTSGAVVAHEILTGVTWTLVTVALAWCLVLAYCEIRWPRARYDDQRWTTVFPLGATAVACLVAGVALGFPVLGVLGTILLWPALAVWVVALGGALRAIAASTLVSRWKPSMPGGTVSRG